MKTIIMKTIISLRKIQVILWMLISMLCSVNLVSQTFEGNVDIPGGDGKGAMIGDILNANGLVFSYTLDKLFIYSSDGTYVDEITFETDYGKFNPYFYRERYCASSLSLMAYNETDQVLYVISPNLQIKIIDISDPQDITVSTYEDSQLPSTFSPLHGLSILKYDRIHRRIYWVIDGSPASIKCPINPDTTAATIKIQINKELNCFRKIPKRLFLLNFRKTFFPNFPNLFCTSASPSPSSELLNFLNVTSGDNTCQSIIYQTKTEL